MPADPTSVAAAVAGMDPAELVDSARRHGLSALVRHELAAAGVLLPEAPARALQADAASVVGTGLRMKALLLRALDALSAAGLPPPVLLKGYGLGLRLYPDPLLRASTDVDLLVDRASLPEAQRALVTIGLRRVDDPGYGDYLDHHHHLSFVGPAGAVELHFLPSFGFGSRLRAEPLLARAPGFEVEGRAARHPAPEDELVYLAVHAAQHAFQRLGWLYDLKLLLLRHPGLDWAEVAAVASASGMSMAVRASLEAAQRAVGLEVPASLAAALPVDAWRSWIARRSFTETELVEARLAGNKGAAFLLRTLLSSGWGASARHVAEGARRIVLRRAVSRR